MMVITIVTTIDSTEKKKPAMFRRLFTFKTVFLSKDVYPMSA